MKRIVMIGFPLTHVRSPGIINPMLRAAGQDVEVIASDVREEELDRFVESSRGADDVLGLIVTTPLKQAICGHLGRRTTIVELTGASNCVRCDGPFWIGANFDGYGLAPAIAAALKPLSRRRILLIGCGGAGSAIAASLVAIATVELSLYDREFAKAASLASRLGCFTPQSRISAISEPAGDVEIVINASTAGMAEDDACPVPKDIVAGAEAVADIVNRDTALKRCARDYGKVLVEGETMVRGQARYLQRFILGNATSERDILAEET